MTAPELSAGSQTAMTKLPLVFKAIGWLTENLYDKESNPSGIINAGIAANTMIKSHLLDRLNSISDKFIPSDLEYNIPYGGAKLRSEIAAIFNRHFNVVEPVSEEDITVTNGCTTAIEMLAFALCNPGDHVLIPAPCYLALENDLGSRAQAVATPVKLPLEESMSANQISYFEQALSDIEASGDKVKVLFLMSPHNPLGASYPRKVLQAFFKFASEHNLYVVMDEIYALSVFGQSNSVAPFESVLSWTDLDSYIDPASVVILHGLSKDFGLNGFRMGWALSPWNKDLTNVLRCYSAFGYRPAYTDRLITKFLSDHEYIDSMLQISQSMLASNYKHVAKFLDQHAIRYIPCTAGHFVWLQLPISACINTLRKLGRLGDKDAADVKWTAENEILVWEDIARNHCVYIPPGQSFFSVEYGWFRLTFSIDKDDLDIALDRLIQACTASA